MPRGRPASANPKLHVSRVKRKNAGKGIYDVYEVTSRYNSKTKNSEVLKSRKIGTLPLDFQDAEKDLIPYERKEKPTAQTIEEALQAVPDVCHVSKVQYPLDVSLLMILLAELNDLHSTENIATYWKVQRNEFERICKNFPNNDISTDTLRRLIIQIGKFQGSDWLTILVNPLLIEYKVRRIANEGKTVGTPIIGDYRNPYIFQSVDIDNRVTLNQVLVNAETNEITNIQKLLEPVNLHGAVVTADATNAQSEFVSFLVNVKECDYLLVLNSRYKKLHEFIKTLFELDPNALKEQTLKDLAKLEPQPVPTQYKEPGQIEIRSIKVLPASLLGQEFLKNWAGLEEGCIVEAVTETTGIKANQNSSHTRYFLTSLRFDEHFVTHQILHRIRNLWCTENNLPFKLSYTFSDDRTQCTNADFLAAKTKITKLANSLLDKAQKIEVMDCGKASSKPVWRVKFSRLENIFLVLTKIFDRFGRI